MTDTIIVTGMKELLMQNDWPTQDRDMQMAMEIVDQHIDLSEGEPLGLIEVVVDRTRNKPISIKISHWVRDILGHFCDEYGQQQGQLVASKVITRLMLRNETIH